MAEIWRCCVCRAVLGILEGDQVTVTHAGRQVMARLPMTQRCHKCGASNHRERQSLEPTVAAITD
jgi:rubredoxin